MKKTLICMMVLACFSELAFCQTSEEGAIQSSAPKNLKAKKLPAVVVLNGIKFPALLVQRDGALFIKVSDLVANGVRQDVLFTDDVQLVTLDPDFKFDRVNSVVELSLPSIYFPESIANSRLRQAYIQPESRFGAWFNYDGRVQSVGPSTGFQAYLDGTISTQWGMLKSQHVYNSLATTAEERFKRISTYFQSSSDESKRTTILGDTCSLPGAWGTPVNFGGIRIARDFTLFPPGFLVNPNYTIKGQATVPSVVEIWEGGQRTYSESFSKPGPFSIPNYVPIKNGVAQVIVRDQYGNATQQDVVLYSTPQQLSDGLDAYSLEAGMLKKDGVYGEMYLGAGYRRGFNLSRILGDVPLVKYAASLIPVTTLEGRVEGVKGDFRFGAGASVASWFGNLTLSGAIGQNKAGGEFAGNANVATPYGSSSGQTGNTYPTNPDAGKSPNIWQFNFDRAFEYSSIKANVFGVITRPTNWVPIGGTSLMKPSTFAGVTIIPSERTSGSFVVTNSGDSSDKHSTKTLSISYGYDRNLSGTLSFTKADNNSMAMLSMTYSFDKSGSAFTSISKDSQSVSYSGGSQDRLDSWSVNVGHDQSGNRFDGSYTTDFSMARLSGAVSQFGNTTGYRAGVSGSVLFTDGAFNLGRSINDSVLVVTSDIPNLPVSLNNQPVGKTNANGQILLTVPSGKLNQIAIDGSRLPFGYSLNSASSESVVQHAGDVATVNLSANRPGWIGVFSINGKRINQGTVVFLNGNRFVASSKSVHAENQPFGKTSVRIDDCEGEIEVPNNSEKKLPRFTFDLQCKEQS